MKFKSHRTYGEDELEHEFETLEELLDWCRAQKCTVIIDAKEDPIDLEIYDNYRE